MHHRQAIELWLYEELFGKFKHSDQSFQHLLASTTLVDFPQFYDIHHLIPLALDTMSPDISKPVFYIRQGGDIIGKDSDKWEIYVEYRKIVSRFLIDQTRSGIPRDPRFSSVNFHLWSRGDKKHYVRLAQYLLSFLSAYPL